MNLHPRRLTASLILTLSTAHPFVARAQTPVQDCKLQKEAQLPLTERNNRFLVEAGINGVKRLFVVDSSAEKSTLSLDAADALNLPRDMTRAEKLNGAGGELASDYPRLVKTFQLGSMQWTDLELPIVSASTFTRLNEPNLAGILGADILSRYDVELDFPAHMLTLYTAQNCLGHFVPWHGDYQSYSPEYTPRHRFIMDIELNGHPLKAVLDTAASRSLISPDAARSAGVDDAMLAHDPATSGQGIGGVQFTTYDHRFDTFQIGTRTFSNAHLEIGGGGFSRGVDMLLGMDFMKWRRVWLSYSTGWVFMQVNAEKAAASPVGAAASMPVGAAPLDAAGQLQTIAASGVAWAGLPDGPIPQFSSHTHITYRMVPHISEVPRLSPQAIPQGPVRVP